MTIDIETSHVDSPGLNVVRQLTRVMLWMRPDGWQSRARRNAWSSMVADSQRRHERSTERESLRRASASAVQHA